MQYAWAGVMIAYLLTNCALGTGTDQFIARGLHLNTEDSSKVFETSWRPCCQGQVRVHGSYDTTRYKMWRITRI
jgi:hypothetical protein